MRPNSRLASEDVPLAVRDEHETPGVEPLAVSLIGLENEAARGDLLSRAGEHGAGCRDRARGRGNGGGVAHLLAH